MIRRVSIVPAKKYSKGNVPYEINIQPFSQLTTLSGPEEWKTNKPIQINFNEIKLKQGLISNLTFIFLQNILKCTFI